MFSVSSGMDPKRHDSKEGPISLQWENSGSSIFSQDEGMSDDPVENLEKAVGVRLIWTGGLTSLRPLERHTEFNAS